MSILREWPFAAASPLPSIEREHNAEVMRCDARERGLEAEPQLLPVTMATRCADILR